ncbi:hypothetical protein K8R32_05260, partial [bacterium]|nr:hypothetical protein [bacterium]
SITEKYMYLACVDGATADGKDLFVGATAYLDEIDALKYLEKYEIKKDFVYAKDAIKQKAEDVARQIEIYLKTNPSKTIVDLQDDYYFKEIAVQLVGKTGYTAVTDYNTLTCRFHSNPKIVDMDLHNLADKLPGFWGIMSRTKGGKEADGIYDWEEADGSIKQKYMYIALVNAKTADNVGFSVAATTYLDEYEKEILKQQIKESLNRQMTPKELLVIAEQITEFHDETIQRQIANIKLWAKSEILLAAARQARQKTKEELFEMWSANENRIYTSVGAVGDGSPANDLNPHVSEYLRDIANSYGHFKEIFLTDVRGYTIAATGATSDFDQGPDDWRIFQDESGNPYFEKYEPEAGGEEWFRKANQANDGLYISGVEWDKSAGTWGIDIVVLVIDNETDETAGVLKAVLNYDYAIKKIVDFSSFGDFHIDIIDQQGIILATSDLGCHPVRHDASDKYIKALEKINNNEKQGWIKTETEIISFKTSDLLPGQIITVFLDIYPGQEDSEQRIIEEMGLSRNAKNVAEKIELIVDGFSRDIRHLSQTIGIKHLLSQVQQDGVLTDTETEKKFYPRDKEKYWQGVYEYFSRFYSQNPGEIDMVRLFDKNGYIVCGVVAGEEDINDCKGDKSWFNDVMDLSIVKSNEVYISPISIARRTNRPVIRYAMSIEVNNERLGLVVINFKADAIYKVFKDEDNILFLDNAYKNAEGEITTDWVVTLADSRNLNYILNESREAASLIKPGQLIGNNGFFEFVEDGQEFVGAYQAINISGKKWHIANILEKDLLKVEIKPESEEEIDLVAAVYWFLGGLAVVFFISFILNRLGVIRIEKNTVLYLLTIVLLTVIGLFVSSTWQITQNMKRETINSANEALAAVAVSRVEHIKTLIKHIKIDVETFATGNIFKDIVNEEIKDMDHDKIIEQTRRRMKTLMEAEPQIKRIRILDKNGNIAMSNIENDIVGNEDVFAEAKAKICIGEVHISARTGQKVINISSPILLEDKFAGVLVITFDFEKINKVVENRSGLGETGETYLINKESHMITPLRFKEDVFLKQKIDSINSKNCFEHAKEAYAKHEKVIGFINYRGVNAVGAHSYIPETEWCLLAEKDEQEIMASVNKNINQTWYFTFGLIGLIILIGIVFNFLLTGSLKKEVEVKTVDIKNQSNKIKEQLKKEEETTRVKEWLLGEQKKAKKELEEKVNELEKFQKLTVGRELKMIELKKKIKNLENK